MAGKQKVACVTGASGMVGRRIVERLLVNGYRVRVLSRKRRFALKDVEVYFGGLEDSDILNAFVTGADHIYHCAAELHDESKMWAVNVQGTQQLINSVERSKIDYFLYLSSAGVVGLTKNKVIDENSPCNPITLYEKTKWEAEKLVARGISDCRVVILRPTNIIDNHQPGILEVTISRELISRLAQLLRSDECAHIVHAMDVANAALNFCEMDLHSPECFIVARDDDPLNSFSGLKKICNSVVNNKPIKNFQNNRYVPIFLPYFLRKLRFKTSNWGDVKYSSKKIIDYGFRFTFDVKLAVSDVLSQTLGFATSSLKQKMFIKQSVEEKNLVVIGASGFIGRNLVQKIARLTDVNIRVLIQKDEQRLLFKSCPNITVFKGTLLQIDTIEKILLPRCTVINLAYMENETRTTNLSAINTLGKACISKNIKRLVHCSTAGVVGNIKNIDINENTNCNARTGYEITKLMIESFLTSIAKDNFELAILRPTSVFGPGGKNLVKLADHLNTKAWPINYFRSCFSGKRDMNLVCVDNVINALFFLCYHYQYLENEIFIVSDDRNPLNNYRDIEKMLLEKMDLKTYPFPLAPFPSFLLTLILRALRRPITQTRRSFNCTKLMSSGYEKVTTIDAELDRFVEWYLTNRSEMQSDS